MCRCERQISSHRRHGIAWTSKRSDQSTVRSVGIPERKLSSTLVESSFDALCHYVIFVSATARLLERKNELKVHLPTEYLYLHFGRFTVQPCQVVLVHTNQNTDKPLMFCFTSTRNS